MATNRPVLSRVLDPIDGSSARFGLRFLWAAIVMLVCLSHRDKLLAEGDLQWHIASGKWMLDNWTLLKSDVFSYTFYGHSWISTAWLSEIFFALVYEYCGWVGILVLGASATTTAFYLIAHYVGRVHGQVWGVITSAIAFPLISPTITIRPHLLTLPIIVAWTIALMRSAAHRQPPWTALPLMVLWANMHGSFTVGIIIAAALGLEALLRADPREWFRTAAVWSAFGMATIGASCLTPMGLDQFRLTIQLMQSNEAMPFTIEWQRAPFHISTILFLCIPLGYVIILSQEPLKNAARIALILLFTALMLKHIRFILFLGVVTPILGSDAMGRIFREAYCTFKMPEVLRRLTRLSVLRSLVAVLVVIIPVIYLRFPVRPPNSVFPLAALSTVPVGMRTKRVFNSFNLGGFLILHGIPTFIDGRTATLFGNGFVTRYSEANAKGRQELIGALLDDYKIEWALVSTTDAFAATIPLLDGWRVHFVDDAAMVLFKN